MPCNCAQSNQSLPWRCKCHGQSSNTPQKGVVNFCDICDPCNENVSTVKLCAFVVPTLEDGRYYKNSFVFVQEDDSVYYISDDRSEIPFGSRPKFINDFDPTLPVNKFKNTLVYDLARNLGYVYGTDGAYETFTLKEQTDPYPVGAVFTTTVENATPAGTWTLAGTTELGGKTVYLYERTA